MSGRLVAVLRPILPMVILCFGPSSSIQPAHAWGRLGHRISARIAEPRLSPSALRAVRDLLEPGETLADAASWADENRRDVPGSGPWHYINVPISEPRFDARFCNDAGCVLSKLDEYRRILADRSASRDQRRLALRLVVHFVQDIHQPLHVGDRDDRGGNDLQLQFFGKGSNLHRIWDSGLLERQDRRESDWVNTLNAAITPAAAERWARITSPEDWADESLAVARRAYCFPGSDDQLRPGARIGRAYEHANLPIVRERLEQSGVRLAALLNAIFR
jgi:hypothetical protein